MMEPRKKKHGFKRICWLGWVREFATSESFVEITGSSSTGALRTFYVKQLAQQSVMEITDLPILANEIEVSAGPPAK